ncbi:MAG: MFS transporter, partial [Niameybacter sp.]
TAVKGENLKLQNAYTLLFLCGVGILVIAVPLLLNLPDVVSYIAITLASFAIMGLATIFSIQMIATVQTETPPELVGKVIALMMSLSMCAQPIGQTIYGFAFDKFQSTTGVILLIVSILSILISLVSKKIFKAL